MQTDDQIPRSGERRDNDRRQAQVEPLHFPDRRQATRRSGKDRRGAPRV